MTFLYRFCFSDKQTDVFLLYSYHNVTTSLEYVLLGTDLARANPKSASFKSPVVLINRFCGFRSL